MTVRSQLRLLLLTFIITMNMGLMGFIRSGLRGDWHIFGVMRDTSEWGYTPSNFVMTQHGQRWRCWLFMIGVCLHVLAGRHRSSQTSRRTARQAAPGQTGSQEDQSGGGNPMIAAMQSTSRFTCRLEGAGWS